jgi:hypothetical protein
MLGINTYLNNLLNQTLHATFLVDLALVDVRAKYKIKLCVFIALCAVIVSTIIGQSKGYLMRQFCLSTLILSNELPSLSSCSNGGLILIATRMLSCAMFLGKDFI